MNLLITIFKCIIFILKPKYVYTITANANYTGNENDSIPLHGTVCLNKTSNNSTDTFISFPIYSFKISFDEQTFIGKSSNLRFHQHSPNNYHNEGYGFQSNDGNFSFGNDDVGTTNNMVFPDPPDFIDFANGGSGTLNGQHIHVNSIKLVRVRCCQC